MSRWWGASGHQGRKMEGGMASSSSPIPIPSLSPPSSHRRSPPLTPRLLAHACRRKVMKAISLKGVLRTEINPSLDKVTVVGDVDSRVLVKKLSKVGKIAEVMAPPPPPSPAAPSEEGKKSDSNGGEKPTSPADEKSTRKDGGGVQAEIQQVHGREGSRHTRRRGWPRRWEDGGVQGRHHQEQRRRRQI
uniref:HMA domain-containing protein n=1 Tax=Oryza glaberrima TaxID=4538 RepID=I1P5C6_ORYGL